MESDAEAAIDLVHVRSRPIARRRTSSVGSGLIWVLWSLRITFDGLRRRRRIWMFEDGDRHGSVVVFLPTRGQPLIRLPVDVALGALGLPLDAISASSPRP